MFHGLCNGVERVTEIYKYIKSVFVDFIDFYINETEKLIAWLVEWDLRNPNWLSFSIKIKLAIQ